MASFLTNLYINFQAANLKEFISLDKGAKQDFCSETCFKIISGNSEVFSAEIEKYAAQYGYASLLNVPTNHVVDTSDANSITYNDQNQYDQNLEQDEWQNHC